MDNSKMGRLITDNTTLTNQLGQLKGLNTDNTSRTTHLEGCNSANSTWVIQQGQSI